MLKNKLLWLIVTLLFIVNGVQAQTRTITGKVTSTNNEAQPGASVAVKGTTKGTVTDANGSYSLSVPNGEVTFRSNHLRALGKKLGPPAPLNDSHK